jgi:predicted cupin superfamily sugar epimerase
MHMATVQDIIKLLDLRPHPTCGFTRETYLSQLQLPATVIPPAYGSSRYLGGVLYFLITPEHPVHLHRIRSDQMYHHYLGEPLEVLLLYPDGTSAVEVIGNDLANGQRPQLMIPGQTFHAGRLSSGQGFALLGTSVWLRAEPPDVEMGSADMLGATYPAMAGQIQSFTMGRSGPGA